jgi:hypothetical protein
MFNVLGRTRSADHLFQAESSPLARTSPNSPRSGARLTKRIAVTGLSCGVWSTADISDTIENNDNFKSKGGTVVVSANSCARIGCYNTSGAYVCNDQGVEITIDMSEITEVMDGLISTCYTGGDTYGISGQMFMDTNGGYNLDIGFCDNDQSTDTPPSAYTPPGPNGNAVSS